METLRLGRQIRAIRLQRNLTQAEVAARARMERHVVGQVELGRWGGVELELIERIARCLDLGLEAQLRSHERGDVERLLDQRHARLVGLAGSVLRDQGWEVELERSFNYFGDRGSVDIVARKRAAQAVLVVEVKTEIVDMQDLLSTLSKKTRVVPGLLAKEQGWQPAAVGAVVVLAENDRMRKAVSRQAALFDIALPGRNREVAHWLEHPGGSLRAVWFVTNGSRECHSLGRRRASGKSGRGRCVQHAKNA